MRGQSPQFLAALRKRHHLGEFRSRATAKRGERTARVRAKSARAKISSRSRRTTRTKDTGKQLGLGL